MSPNLEKKGGVVSWRLLASTGRTREERASSTKTGEGEGRRISLPRHQREVSTPAWFATRAETGETSRSGCTVRLAVGSPGRCDYHRREWKGREGTSTAVEASCAERGENRGSREGGDESLTQISDRKTVQNAYINVLKAKYIGVGFIHAKSQLNGGIER